MTTRLAYCIAVLGLLGIVCNAQSVTIRGPSSCTEAESITVTVTVTYDEVPKSVFLPLGFNQKVELMEEDVLFNDKIATQDAWIGKEYYGGPWSKTFSFTFVPSAYEKGKNLELFAKSGGVKSSRIKVKCR